MVISHSDRVDLWRLKSIMQFYALQLFLDAPVCSYPSVFHLFMSPFMRRTICFYYWMLYPRATLTQGSVFAPFKKPNWSTPSILIIRFLKIDTHIYIYINIKKFKPFRNIQRLSIKITLIPKFQRYFIILSPLETLTRTLFKFRKMNSFQCIYFIKNHFSSHNHSKNNISPRFHSQIWYNLSLLFDETKTIELYDERREWRKREREKEKRKKISWPRGYIRNGLPGADGGVPRRAAECKETERTLNGEDERENIARSLSFRF